RHDGKIALAAHDHADERPGVRGIRGRRRVHREAVLGRGARVGVAGGGDASGERGRSLGSGAVPPLPPVRIAHPHVFVDADGSPLISGSRVPVRRLFSWHRGGTSVETLLRRYPQLGPARVLDALAFAYDNLELVSADLARERDALAREQTTALE